MEYFFVLHRLITITGTKSFAIFWVTIQRIVSCSVTKRIRHFSQEAQCVKVQRTFLRQCLRKVLLMSEIIQWCESSSDLRPWIQKLNKKWIEYKRWTTSHIKSVFWNLPEHQYWNVCVQLYLHLVVKIVPHLLKYESTNEWNKEYYAWVLHWQMTKVEGRQHCRLTGGLQGIQLAFTFSTSALKGLKNSFPKYIPKTIWWWDKQTCPVLGLI